MEIILGVEGSEPRPSGILVIQAFRHFSVHFLPAFPTISTFHF